jgi:Fe-S-cluster containining protein
MPRTEYGFRRTTCPCRACALTCQHLPGPLAPPDVERIARFLEYTDLEKFARENLVTSDGPRVVTSGRKIIHLPTLVPATQANGHCKFLQDNLCTIHAVSPYGCAFLDAHLSDADLAARSRPLHDDILHDLESGGPYSTLWQTLHDAQLTSPPTATRRYDLAKALRRERLR